jgi:hypothetical protein
MRTCFRIIASLLIVTSWVSGDQKPKKSTTPLTADEISVYKAVLERYAAGKALNVAARTYALDSESSINGLDRDECLGSIQLQNLAIAAHAYHDLPTEILGKQMKLVDPDAHARIVRKNDPQNAIGNRASLDAAVKRAFGSGLFSLSEIAFDKDHHYAAVAYSFWCGSLCGHGSTVILRKTGNTWKEVKQCGGFVS